MFNKKNWLAQTGFVCVGLLGVAVANAQDPACPYNNASIQGTYGTVIPYGSSTAQGLAVTIADGKGIVNSDFILNQPLTGSTTGERTITSGNNKGTYAVNCDGSGVRNRILTLADGTTSLGVDDLLITKSVLRNGKLIATEYQEAPRIPSAIIPGGVFVTRTLTLRPDTGSACYTLESLQGSYGVANSYGAHVALGLQAEILDGRGNLTRTGFLNQPTVGSPTGERTVGSVTSRGSYTVNCNGTGTITRLVTRPDGTTAPAADDFVITEAVEKDGKLIATTIVDAQRDPSVIVPGGIFLTRVHTLRYSPDPKAIVQLASSLQFLACGTTPPVASCQTTVNVWNYYLTYGLGSVAPPLVVGDGSRSLTVVQYLEARVAAGL